MRSAPYQVILLARSSSGEQYHIRWRRVNEICRVVQAQYYVIFHSCAKFFNFFMLSP